MNCHIARALCYIIFIFFQDDDSVIECVRDKTPNANVQAGNSKNDGKNNVPASPVRTGLRHNCHFKVSIYLQQMKMTFL